ncbi:hypothetical protein C8A00DRAFT_30508 [Chaetomidium leptoderma]|uniref:S-Me-THD-like C-terminal domain-containing protein n=1 Tax=Chaetomidium leptoderma TaxID=669021 RepID=A0AAN7A071_9PEZI|nr:hypothetical protein C8A00DRAFT_30508 [Chaetomidium leptoderma]
MFASAGVAPADVASVTIGTTHFVNAVVEHDAARLSRVAVIRLCGPFSKHVPPCVDWPADLRGTVLGHYALVKGGLEVDGALIGDVDEGEVVDVCREIRARGIRSVVVNGVFSPIDAVARQEERAAEIPQHQGKIVGVERMLRKGHIYGECIIEGGDVVDPDSSATSPGGREFSGRIKIPFKNENIAAIRIPDNTKEGELEKQEDVMAIVPGLVCVIDAQNGEAVGTPEYRYGLLVIVLGIAASDKWTGSQRGIELGGPKAFGFKHLEYQPLGRFVKPVSVVDEFDGASESSV